MNLGGRQDVVGAGSAGGRFRVREQRWTDQAQLAQAHVLHGARHRPDIAGMLGFYQDDADGYGANGH